MHAYRWSVRFKLGLIVFAGIIAVASLLYTRRLVDRLREREQAVIELWADAQEEVVEAQRTAFNPHQDDLRELEAYLRDLEAGARPDGSLSPEQVEAFQEAVRWAQTMPPTDEVNFILNNILEPNPFGIPAVITDSTGQRPRFWRNVDVPDTLSALSPSDSAQADQDLRARKQEMAEAFDPIPIRVNLSAASDRFATGPGPELTQYVYYGESALVRELRIFPWVQFASVGLFILVGYLGFSYIRRSEQNNLWTGMAREAAHQLGTPLTSLMGWVEVLRTSPEESQRNEALDEIENDVERLRRIASRFSDIGSQPKLERRNLVPIIEQSVDYLRRRLPHRGQDVTLDLEVPERLEAEVNEELFAWVLENLLKNALDAIDDDTGRIEVTASQTDKHVYVAVSDTGSGIERAEWGTIFRPGYSTKQRGWGLGLSLARRVVETYHDGELELVDSTVDEGSTFRITLPV